MMTTTSRRAALVSAMLALVLAPGAFAQEAEDAPAEATEPQDIITVIGKKKQDRAMEAFLNGDYETAEIEFEKNLKCAERVEMLSEFALEQSYSESLDAEAGVGTPSGFGDQGGITMYNTPQETAGYYNNNPRDANRVRERTCDYPYWQLYMAGLSEIQLGKYEEAKKSFYRVIALTNDPALFDAHYRIALLELMDGNVDKAERRLDRLKTLQERCHRKGDRCESRKELDEVVAYLDKAVSEAQA